MGQVRVVPATGMVFVGTGTVWENPTRRLPVLNPIGSGLVPTSLDLLSLPQWITAF
jgi:hypothetical protein